MLENLQMGAMLPRARASAKRNLDDVFAMFPRLAERKAQYAGTMSGGEQQMLAIGRCLMGAPELIMFDEPSLGLAPLVVQEVLHTIRMLNERRLTILLVEQNVAVSLKISNRAYVLENGRVVMSGSGEKLLHDDRVRQAYLGLGKSYHNARAAMKRACFCRKPLAVACRQGTRPRVAAAKADRLAWLAYPKAGQLGTDLNRDIVGSTCWRAACRPCARLRSTRCGARCASRPAK